MFAILQTSRRLVPSRPAARPLIVGSAKMERNASLTADGESSAKKHASTVNGSVPQKSGDITCRVVLSLGPNNRPVASAL